MDHHSHKCPPIDVPVLIASGRAVLPNEPNCYNQLAEFHRLGNSELNFNDHKFNMNMQMLRNSDGLGAALKVGMDRFAARQTGRLPFLKTNNLLDDVITGRYEQIDFEDFLNIPEHKECMVQPHIIMEDSLGIHF